MSNNNINEMNELKELIEKISLENKYDKKIKVSITKEFYKDGWITVKFNVSDDWDEEKNQVKFLTILQGNERYNELVEIFKMPPIVDFTSV